MGPSLVLTQVLLRENRDEAAHAARVTRLALRLARRLQAAGRHVAALEVGGPLHDIGKLALAPSLLTKAAPLAPEEIAEIRTHPERGAELLERDPRLAAARACVLHHHERWDGAGYPFGLRGEEIPFEARILAVADAYDAMTSDRPYRRPMPHEAAVAEVARCAGSQFDPQVAEAFLQLDAG